MFKSVTEEEFKNWLKSYPRRLKRNVFAAFEPPLISYNDFERAPKWPDSVVAKTSATGHFFEVLEDIESAVPDDGKRDTDTPIYDLHGTELKEGDKVKANWGWSSSWAMPWNTERDIFESSPRAGYDHYRIETIMIREKGTKYECWSFESCHNLARGFEMVKISDSVGG